jgi:hypothetical protein
MTSKKFKNLRFLRFTELEMASNLLGPEAYIHDHMQKAGYSLADIHRIWDVVYPDGQEKHDCTIVIVHDRKNTDKTIRQP